MVISFDQLQRLVKSGDTIDITDMDGRKTSGTLAELSTEILTRQQGSGSRDVAVPPVLLSELNVKEVTIERKDSLWNGSLIGLAAAGVPWLIVCAANDWCYYNEYGGENLLRRAAIVSTVMGAGIGALIDASLKKRTTVYRAPGQRSLRIQVTPLFSTSKAAFQTSLQF